MNCVSAGCIPRQHTTCRFSRLPTHSIRGLAVPASHHARGMPGTSRGAARRLAACAARPADHAGPVAGAVVGHPGTGATAPAAAGGMTGCPGPPETLLADFRAVWDPDGAVQAFLLEALEAAAVAAGSATHGNPMLSEEAWWEVVDAAVKGMHPATARADWWCCGCSCGHTGLRSYCTLSRAAAGRSPRGGRRPRTTHRRQLLALGAGGITVACT